MKKWILFLTLGIGITLISIVWVIQNQSKTGEEQYQLICYRHLINKLDLLLLRYDASSSSTKLYGKYKKNSLRELSKKNLDFSQLVPALYTVSDSLKYVLTVHKNLVPDRINTLLKNIGRAQQIFKDSKDSLSYYHGKLALSEGILYYYKVKSTFLEPSSNAGFEIRRHLKDYEVGDKVQLLIKPHMLKDINGSYKAEYAEINIKGYDDIKVQNLGGFVHVSFLLKEYRKLLPITGTITYKITDPDIGSLSMELDTYLDL